MANPIPKPIIGAFEDIGESIVSQVKSIPKDVGQTALESIGLSTGGKKQGQQAIPPPTPGVTQEAGSSWNQIDQTQDQKIKKDIARNALQELLRPRQQANEPSIWERMNQEEEQKKAQKAQQQPQGPIALPSSGARKVPGMKHANKAKQLGSEIGKNARQD